MGASGAASGGKRARSCLAPRARAPRRQAAASATCITAVATLFETDGADCPSASARLPPTSASACPRDVEMSIRLCAGRTPRRQRRPRRVSWCCCWPTTASRWRGRFCCAAELLGDEDLLRIVRAGSDRASGDDRRAPRNRRDRQRGARRKRTANAWSSRCLQQVAPRSANETFDVLTERARTSPALHGPLGGAPRPAAGRGRAPVRHGVRRAEDRPDPALSGRGFGARPCRRRNRRAQYNAARPRTSEENADQAGRQARPGPDSSAPRS